MQQVIRRFWNDERGSVEMAWAFVATILVLGAITGALLTQQMNDLVPEEPARVQVVAQP